MASEQISADTHQAGKARIFVGGVSESVSKDDLEKIFTQKSLGEVVNVEFVRTKGRSFAYVDFSPNDDHSLSKLLSMYNGCVWKGGKLKLEKAKEHYLAHLQREWSDDAENESSILLDSCDKKVSSEHDKKASDTKQLHIFFPRLRKVKSIPFNGTGKHKYSFQRVDVPDLPVHFCDCEEHNPPVPFKKITALTHYDVNKCFDNPEEAQGGGMNDDEVNVMTSVMNKLMQKGSNLNAKSGTELTNSGYESNKPVTDGADSNILVNGIQLNENLADSEGDEDNLIINITKREDSMTQRRRGREKKMNSGRKRPRSDWMESSVDGQQQDSTKAKRSDIMLKSKTIVTHDKGDKSEDASGSTGGKEILPTSSTPSMPLTFEVHSTEPDKQPTPGLSWSQKSSWKELVGTKSIGFNISHVLPEKASSKECHPQPNTSTASIFTDIEVDEDHPIEEVLVERQSSKIKETDYHLNKEIKESNNLVENLRNESDELVEHRKKESNGLVEHQKKDSNGLVEHQKNESNGLVETVFTESAASSEKSGRGASWRQKSSWTQLINQDSGLFSISQILPTPNFEKQGQPVSRTTDVLKSEHREDRSNLSQGGARNFEQFRKEIPESGLEIHVEENGLAASGNQISLGHVDGKKYSSSVSTSSAPSKKTTLGNVEMGETCTFMRSEASLKEWGKFKAALSGSRKKKSKAH